jgi:hypothetical protein
MTQGDFETFYPFQAGVGKNAPNNFESSFQGYYGESSATGDDLDDSNDNQDDTDGDEGEAGEVVGIEETQQLPCFRELVRAKKKELKAQFGKGRFRIGECGVKPFRENATKYSPIVRMGESRTCIGWSASCAKKCFGICCGPTTCTNWAVIPGNTQAYDNASERFSQDLAAWNSCEKDWIPGWRREWRRFKKDGGLNAFKQQSVSCILGTAISDQPIPPDGLVPAPAPTPTILPAKMTAAQLLALRARNQAKNQSQRMSIEDDGKDKTKSYIMFGIVAVILIAGGFYIYKTLKK